MASFFISSLMAQWEVIEFIDHYGCLNEIEFTNSTNGYIVANNLIGNTTDAGNTWNLDTTKHGAFEFIDFIDTDTGLICCNPEDGYDIVLTFDKGENWTFPSLNLINPFITDAALLKNGRVILAEYADFSGSFTYGTSNYYSDYTGMFFLAPTLPPHDMEFVNDSIGFICGDISTAVGNSLFKTIDAGNSWYTSENMDGPTYYISFPSIGIGYGIGDERRVWKTIDTGETWNMLPFDFGGYTLYDDFLQFYDIYFFNDSIGYLEGRYIHEDFTESVSILRTLDGGSSWYKTEIFDDNFTGINSFNCTSADTCYAVGCDEIYKTVNGGGIDTTTTLININEKFKLNFYPNPTSNIVSVESNEVGAYSIYNLSGNLVQSGDLLIGKNDLLVSNLPSGLYSISIVTKTGSTLYKIIVL